MIPISRKRTRSLLPDGLVSEVGVAEVLRVPIGRVRLLERHRIIKPVFVQGRKAFRVEAMLELRRHWDQQRLTLERTARAMCVLGD